MHFLSNSASVYVVLVIIVVTLVVIVVVTFNIVITLEPSQELPKKFQLSKLKTVEANVFVVVVVIIVVTLVVIVVVVLVYIGYFLHPFQSTQHDQKHISGHQDQPSTMSGS